MGHRFLVITGDLGKDRSSRSPQISGLQRVWPRLLTLARPYWWQLGLLTGASLGTSMLRLAYPLLTGLIIDSVVAHNISTLHMLVFCLLSLAAFQALLRFGQTLWMNMIGERMIARLRMQLYSHIQRLPLHFFLQHRTGEILNNLTSDVTRIQDTITTHLLNIVQNVLILLLGLVLVITGPDLLLASINRQILHLPLASHEVNFGMALLLVALALAPAIFLPTFTRAYVRKLMRRELDLLSQATALSEETISNAKVVQAFTREDYEIERYQRLIWQQFAVTCKRVRTTSAVGAFSMLLGVGGLAAFLWYGGTAVLQGTLSLGTLTMMVVYFTVLSQPFFSLAGLYAQLRMALGAAERLCELLDQSKLVNDIPGALALSGVAGEICFENVDFSYDGATRVLHAITFRIEPGTVVALVGPSGAGKTTIVNLLLRFFDIQSGRITIDGYDLRQVQLKSWREQIGVVLQEPVLFSATIRENIAYGCLTASQEEIEAVARAANAHEFIECLPEKYDTMVGERGFTLSGGQRQRLAIARALLRNPRLLILDEATSSLDGESDFLVQQALERLMKGRTTIVIAHRLSTVQHADKIVMMEKGRIVEEGTHKELLARAEAYRRLFRQTEALVMAEHRG
jgi:subfamily B ATP-binding cassette protein MsbA